MNRADRHLPRLRAGAGEPALRERAARRAAGVGGYGLRHLAQREAFDLCRLELDDLVELGVAGVDAAVGQKDLVDVAEHDGRPLVDRGVDVLLENDRPHHQRDVVGKREAVVIGRDAGDHRMVVELVRRGAEVVDVDVAGTDCRSDAAGVHFDVDLVHRIDERHRARAVGGDDERTRHVGVARDDLDAGAVAVDDRAAGELHPRLAGEVRAGDLLELILNGRAGGVTDEEQPHHQPTLPDHK